MEDIKSESNGKMNMAQLNAINKIKYGLPTNLNVVERRQNKVNFSDQNAYVSTSGSEVVVRLQASTDYVYGKNSYLTFDISANVTGGLIGEDQRLYGFNNNTAASVFDRVLFEDRSGSELERNDSLNRYVAQVCPLHWGGEYSLNGVANAVQYSSAVNTHNAGIPEVNSYQKNGAASDYALNTSGGTEAASEPSPLTVVIPLRWFLGIFNNETLIPSMLISGSLIRFRLAGVNQALEVLEAGAIVPTVNSYTISNPRVVLDSLSLSPVVQKNLMEQSQAGGGLDYTYETVYYQPGNPGT